MEILIYFFKRNILIWNFNTITFITTLIFNILIYLFWKFFFYSIINSYKKIYINYIFDCNCNFENTFNDNFANIFNEILNDLNVSTRLNHLNISDLRISSSKTKPSISTKLCRFSTGVNYKN